jgi:transposase InsO family protein
VVEKALSYLAEDGEMSLPFLVSVLSRDPEITAALALVGIEKISRSTLQRRLAGTNLYPRIQRERKRGRPRGRWVPQKCHSIWHLDAKGPMTKVTSAGAVLTFHVLSILDGASRAVLAAQLVDSPDLGATVRVFRRAIQTYGLPEKIYMDRASTFDTPTFRRSLAVLGVHRIPAKPKNPQVNGKIEAYHRCLSLWFARRLAKQVVVDWTHLEQLFEAVLDYYQGHRNREIRSAPRDLLAGRTSERSLPPGLVLQEAFLESLGQLKAHRTTGEVDLKGGRGKYLVPPDLRGERLEILADPDRNGPVYGRVTGRSLFQLERAQVHPRDAKVEPQPGQRWGRGILQALYDNWRGKVRPIAEPGFGLTEVFDLLSRVTGRHVPRTDAEASLVQQLYSSIGPFTRKAVESAMSSIQTELGPGRPLKTYLDAMSRRVARTISRVAPRKNEQQNSTGETP